eukprot:3139571-Rhodomonas_salina.4
MTNEPEVHGIATSCSFKNATRSVSESLGIGEPSSAKTTACSGTLRESIQPVWAATIWLKKDTRPFGATRVASSLGDTMRQSSLSSHVHV